jgi:hypothetical protein
MNTLPPNVLIALIVTLAVVVSVVAALMVRQQRTTRLRRKFGPEYDLTVARHRSKPKAEAELLRREQRVARLKIVDLPAADVQRYSLAWDALQSRFVDNPKGAVLEADQLVQEVMQKRGYPMGEFDSLAADISVRYPSVVSNYRAARAIAARAGAETDTEDLRKAVVHYRSLFDELLGGATMAAAADSPATRHIPVHS